MLGFLVLPTSVLAFGPHDGLSCTGCHALHTAKGDVIFAVAPNTTDINSRTNQPESGIAALCLGCHQDSANGGLGVKPIASHMSHPFGMTSVNPKVANVPSGLLENGRFECTACHDPHPSNPNYKYLRVDTNGGKDMQRFCVTCHGMKAEAQKSQGLEVFSSMDESKAGANTLAVPSIGAASITGSTGSASPGASTPAAPKAQHKKPKPVE